MALTTSDEIQKQLTVIFGSKTGIISPEIEVGDIIGIGKLSVKRTEVLIKKTLNFIYAYNAMLQDYAGCKLYSMEFSLDNFDKENEGYNIMPKSMLLIPGEYKDCATLMLLLSPEMSLLAPNKAKKSVNELGKLYFEVEEAINRPEVDKPQQHQILSKFAHRFALKLQGKVIEGKWKKKLVGIRSEDNDQQYKKYLSAHISKETNWEDKKIVPTSFKFRKLHLNLRDDEEFEFLKTKMLPSSVKLILKNSFQLTSNLFDIANTGTVDDVQNQLLIALLSQFYKNTREDYETEAESEFNTQHVSLDCFKEKFLPFIQSVDEMLDNFQNLSEMFCKTSRVEPLEVLISSYKEEMKMRTESLPLIKKTFIKNLVEITSLQLEEGVFDDKEKVRCREFEPIFFYIKENTKFVVEKILKSIPKFNQHCLLFSWSEKLVKSVFKEFDGQKKPVVTLGKKYLMKFSQYLKNEIEKSTALDQLIEGDFFNQFKFHAKRIISSFIEEVEIAIEDLMGFVEIMHANDQNLLNHIKKLLTFPKEVEFIGALILRHSSLQNYLKEVDVDGEFSPNIFINSFSDFVKRRLSAFRLNWKSKIFEWMDDFKTNFEPLYQKNKEEGNAWPKVKIINEFVDFLEEKISTRTTIEGFKTVLHDYISTERMKIENKYLPEILNSYEMSLDLIEQVPDYIHQVFLKSVEQLEKEEVKNTLGNLLGDYPSLNSLFNKFEEKISSMQLDSLSAPAQSLKSRTFEEEVDDIFHFDGFYEFILSTEMKYFSKLKAKPERIILKTSTNDYAADKNIDLSHIIELKYFKRFIRTTISSNLNKVRSFVSKIK